jgi:hypothetical protein
MAKNVDNFFMYLLAIYTSFENCLFSLSTNLFIGLFVLWVFNFESYLYTLDINVSMSY